MNDRCARDGRRLRARSLLPLALAIGLLACSSRTPDHPGGVRVGSPTLSDGSTCPHAAPDALLPLPADVPPAFKMQPRTLLTPTPPQTFVTGAMVSFLKHAHVGFYAISAAAYSYSSAAAASDALAANKESQASFGLLTPVSAPTLGDESYAVTQTVRGQYFIEWRRCGYLFSINVQSVSSVDPAVSLARQMDAAAVGT